LFDRASAPRATVDGDSLWRYSLQVEPPASDPIHTVVKHPNFVNGVFGSDEHTVARVEILLSNLFERSCVLDPGRQRFRDGNQFVSPETGCAVPIDTSTRGCGVGACHDRVEGWTWASLDGSGPGRANLNDWTRNGAGKHSYSFGLAHRSREWRFIFSLTA
jgi:hypothetical protein